MAQLPASVPDVARFKDFDAAASEQADDPITFRMGGREWGGASSIPAAYLLKLARAEAAGDQTALLAFDEFITCIIEEDQRDAFHAMLEDKRIDLPTLRDLGRWILEQTAGNPTSAASSSPARPSKRGQRPRVVSLDGGSRSRTSASAVS
jgi:hypothetical protein